MKNILFLCGLWLLISGTTNAQETYYNTDNGKITVTPITHGSLVLQHAGKTIYVDPYGGREGYGAVPKPDLILITDIHGDHLDKETLKSLDIENAHFITPSAVKEQLSDLELNSVQVLNNGDTTSWDGITIEATPMYNLPETADSRHPKGRGNGYLLTISGARIYIAGDTEDTEEMRALQDIDIAFLPMNLPYTMDVSQAAEATLAFKPKVVYPYHFRGQGGTLANVEEFKRLVENESSQIEVRLVKWY